MALYYVNEVTGIIDEVDGDSYLVQWDTNAGIEEFDAESALSLAKCLGYEVTEIPR